MPPRNLSNAQIEFCNLQPPPNRSWFRASHNSSKTRGGRPKSSFPLEMLLFYSNLSRPLHIISDTISGSSLAQSGAIIRPVRSRFRHFFDRSAERPPEIANNFLERSWQMFLLSYRSVYLCRTLGCQTRTINIPVEWWLTIRNKRMQLLTYFRRFPTRTRAFLVALISLQSSNWFLGLFADRSRFFNN